MKRLLKNALRPYAVGPLRIFYDWARGITSNPISHLEVASLIGKSSPTIIEIGCNDGADTKALLNAMPNALIFCFEPEPRAVAKFKTSLGPLAERITLVQAAVSDRNCQLDFYQSTGGEVSGGWDQSGSIRRPKNHLVEHPWLRFDSTILVNAVRLDDWCVDNKVAEVDFIWMDAQGAEGDVIKGASAILRNTRFLYTEYSNNEVYEGQPSLRQLKRLLPMFDVVTRYPGDVLFKNRNYQ